MRNFLVKAATVATLGLATLALPATAAFAGTPSGHSDGLRDPRPCPTVTVTPNTLAPLTSLDRGNKCDPRGNHEGEHNGNNDHGNNWDRCKLPVRFTDFQGGDNRDFQRGDNQGNNDWRILCRPTQGHHAPKCPRCIVQSIVFNLSHGSTHATEVSGPVLYNGEKVTYQGHTYYLKNVLWHSFQASNTWGGPAIRNLGRNIWHGVAHTVCPKVTVNYGGRNPWLGPLA